MRDWLDARTGFRAGLKHLLDEPLPSGVGWWFVTGSVVLFLLTVQLLTGVVLAIYYVPSPDYAYDSIRFIMERVTFGRVLRGLHFFGASFIVVAAVVHMLRVVLLGSYKKPREANWMVGVVLLLIVLGFALTGYLLPWDQKAYWATTVTINIARTAPFGELVSRLLKGGSDVGALTLLRWYGAHVFLLPACLIAFTVAHLYLLRRQGISGPIKALPGPPTPFYPYHAIKDTIVVALVFAVLLSFAMIFKAPLDAVADPTDATYVPRPEWYFTSLFELLKHFPGPFEPVATMVIPGVVVVLLFLLPFLDRRPEREPAKRRLVIGSFAAVGAGIALLTYMGLRSTPASADPSQARLKPDQKAGVFFKNVTTSTLKELSVDDFLATMGVISADLSFDCADCHPGAGTEKVDWVTDTEVKKTTRSMVEMVAAINRMQFAGAQKVTCWTCHHGRNVPATSIMLDNLYDAIPEELDDLVFQDEKQPSPDQVLDKYVQALGGAQRLAGLTSWVATGNSIGFGGLGGTASFTIFSKAPNQRAVRIKFPADSGRPDSVWTFDGTTGWIKTPNGSLPEHELVGHERDGQRFEAQLAFPGQIKQALTVWRVGPRRGIAGQLYTVVQGNGPRSLMVTLYFDQKTGLLSRMVRYGRSPVGNVLTQVDYADYRNVDGIQFPFELKFTWLDGQYTAKLTDIKLNVPIDEATFGRP